jgi:hypothetical protein
MHENDWAKALSEFWGDQAPGSRALMMLERSLLCEVASHVGRFFNSPEEAESDFVATVQSYLLSRSHRTWCAEAFRPNGPHRFLLQIGIQVYAASKMLPDPEGKFTERAYHPQLDLLLGKRLSKRRFNLNDQADYHQELWRERLMEWVDHKQLRLKLPEDHGHNRNHVQLPMSQMVFRENDLQQLPNFFVEAGFWPTDVAEGEVFDEDQIAHIGSRLRQLQNNPRCFSAWARSVLDDAYKFEVAVSQIEEALRTWDGRVWLQPIRRRSASNRKNKKTRWVWIGLRMTQRRLRVVSGASSFTAKAISPADLSLLLSAKETGSGDRLDFRDGLTLFAYETEDAAYKQADYVDAGQRGVLLSGPSRAANWNRVLNCEQFAEIEGCLSGDEVDEWEWIAGLPAGCRMLLFRVKDNLSAPDSIPELWRPFLRLPSARLITSGGLRIGRGEHFVTGAGPQLAISGNYLPSFIHVDGERIRISGRMVQLDQFSEIGVHEVIARYDGKPVRKSFRVSDPDNSVPMEPPSRGWTFHEDRWPTWEATVEAEDESEARLGYKVARLFGVRGINLEKTEVSSQPLPDDRLTAITLLSRLPSRQHSEINSAHPLVRHLLMTQTVVRSDIREVHQ